MKHEAWGPGLHPIGLELDAEQHARLDAYEDLLIERAVPLRMLAESDLPRLRERHVLDALRGAVLLPSAVGDVCDLGSGAGLPGIPIAIARPDAAVVLAERRRNRAAFLELAVERLGLTNAEVWVGRAEALPPASFDACLARAFAPPLEAWKTARPLLRSLGVLLYWAGEGFDPEEDAPADVRVTISAAGSLADAGPVVIMAPQ